MIGVLVKSGIGSSVGVGVGILPFGHGIVVTHG